MANQPVLELVDAEPVEPTMEDKPRGGWVRGILGWLGTIALCIAVAGAVIWSGLSFNVVATDSMTPTLDPKDMVITVDTKLIQPEVGSIVVFTANFFETAIPPHVHRIVGVEPNGDWITKGDNATVPDPWRVKPQDVQGVVIGHVPTQLIRSPVLLGAILFAFLVMLFWPRNGNKDEDGDGEQQGESSPDGA